MSGKKGPNPKIIWTVNKFMAHFTQGMWQHESPLLQLPYFDRSNVKGLERKLKSKNREYFKELLDEDSEERKLLRKHFKGEEEKIKDVEDALDAFSRFEFEVDYYTQLEDFEEQGVESEAEKEEGNEDNEKEKLIKSEEEDDDEETILEKKPSPIKTVEPSNVSPALKDSGKEADPRSPRVEIVDGKSIRKGLVEVNDLMTLIIKIRRVNKVVGHVHSKKIDFFKKERVAATLIEQGNNIIIPMHNQFSDEKEIKMETKFSAPGRPMTMKFKLYVQSDSYVGVDTEFLFDVVVGESSGVVVGELHPDDTEALENLKLNRIWGDLGQAVDDSEEEEEYYDDDEEEEGEGEGLEDKEEDLE